MYLFRISFPPHILLLVPQLFRLNLFHRYYHIFSFLLFYQPGLKFASILINSVVFFYDLEI